MPVLLGKNKVVAQLEVVAESGTVAAGLPVAVAELGVAEVATVGLGSPAEAGLGMRPV